MAGRSMILVFSTWLLLMWSARVEGQCSPCNCYQYMGEFELQSCPAEIQYPNTLTLDHAGITAISAYHGVFPVNVMALMLQNNYLSYVSPDCFWNTRSMDNLNFAGNKITRFDSGTFSTMTLLTQLYLQYNQLTTLPANLLANNKLLRTLNMNNNKISSLDVSFFSANIFLSVLGIHNNQLTALHNDTFIKNNLLSSLYLHYNQLEGLPVGLFRSQQNMQTFIVCYNSITSLPLGIFHPATNLANLDLSHNKLTTLPDGIFRWNQKLNAIALDGNAISSLPENLFKYNHLSALSFLGNPIVSVPNKACILKAYPQFYAINDPTGIIQKYHAQINDICSAASGTAMCMDGGFGCSCASGSNYAPDGKCEPAASKCSGFTSNTVCSVAPVAHPYPALTSAAYGSTSEYSCSSGLRLVPHPCPGQAKPGSVLALAASKGCGLGLDAICVCPSQDPASLCTTPPTAALPTTPPTPQRPTTTHPRPTTSRPQPPATSKPAAVPTTPPAVHTNPPATKEIPEITNAPEKTPAPEPQQTTQAPDVAQETSAPETQPPVHIATTNKPPVPTTTQQPTHGAAATGGNQIPVGVKPIVVIPQNPVATGKDDQNGASVARIQKIIGQNLQHLPRHHAADATHRESVPNVASSSSMNAGLVGAVVAAGIIAVVFGVAFLIHRNKKVGAGQQKELASASSSMTGLVPDPSQPDAVVTCTVSV